MLLQTGVLKIGEIFHFSSRSLYAMQTIVKFYVGRFRNQPVNQKPIALFCRLSKHEKLEIAIRAALSIGSALAYAAALWPTPLQFSQCVRQPSPQTTDVTTSYTIFRFASLLSPTTTQAGGASRSF